MLLFHVTTPKKAKRYSESGFIRAPVRGFENLQAAMAWTIKTGRTVIYEIDVPDAVNLPDHHNHFGDAFWSDTNASSFKCVLSGDSYKAKTI